MSALKEPADAAAPVRTPARGVRRDALIYTIGVVTQRSASFLLLPVYTRLLTPADYGLMELLDLTLEIVTILMSAGTTAGVLRFYYKRRTQAERDELISSVYVLLAALNLGAALLIVVFARPIHVWALDSSGQQWFLYIVAAKLFVSSGVTVPMVLMQAAGKPKQFVAASLSLLMLQLILNLVLVVGLRLGVAGVLASSFTANLILCLGLLVWMSRQVKFRFSKQTAWELRRFAVPYQVAYAGSFVLTFGDRLFLQKSTGLVEVGIYSLAYKFGFLTSEIGASPYMRAWTPQRFALADRPMRERDREYARGFAFLGVVLYPVSVGLATGARPLLRVMSDPAFLPAATVAPVLVLAYVLQAWSDVMRFGMDVSERTVLHMISVWVSVVVIVTAYAVLIPWLGIWGAALATLTGFAVRLGVTTVLAQRVWPVRLGWPRHLAVVGFACIATIALVLGGKDGSLLTEVASCVAAVALTACASIAILLSRADLAAALARVACVAGRRRG